jgi:hypothetical protein
MRFSSSFHIGPSEELKSVKPTTDPENVPILVTTMEYCTLRIKAVRWRARHDTDRTRKSHGVMNVRERYQLDQVTKRDKRNKTQHRLCAQKYKTEAERINGLAPSLGKKKLQVAIAISGVRVERCAFSRFVVSTLADRNQP